MTALFAAYSASLNRMTAVYFVKIKTKIASAATAANQADLKAQTNFT
jgi:hypothetical protein